MNPEGASFRAPDLPLDLLELARGIGAPLHRQLYDHFRNLILQRVLRPQARLPATRALAAQLGISRNTVMAAYAQLESEGFISTRQGARPHVVDLQMAEAVDLAEGATPLADPGKSPSKRGDLMLREQFRQSSPELRAFHPGLPEIRLFPFASWRRLLTRRLRSAGQDLFGYHAVAGYPPLRLAITRYLAASRGVHCNPEQVIVTTGAQAALDLLARLLLDPGDTVWIEEPGYTGAQSVCLAAGARLVALPVSERGWLINEVASAPPPRLIFLTPSCQSPLGITMRMEERLQIIEIARQANAWIIEDDFDSEYRFGAQPFPAMQGIDRTGRTIYVGTFAKTLFPALRIGFVVLPSALCGGFDRAVFHSGAYAPLILQAALADFIDDGHFARHLRRTRRVYAARRVLFQELCRSHLGEWLEPLGGDAGMQTVWWLKPPWIDEVVAEEAKRRSIMVAPLSSHYRHGNPRNGLTFGYAALTGEEMRLGLTTLQALFREARPARDQARGKSARAHSRGQVLRPT